jgi:hypothetical protein
MIHSLASFCIVRKCWSLQNNLPNFDHQILFNLSMVWLQAIPPVFAVQSDPVSLGIGPWVMPLMNPARFAELALGCFRAPQVQGHPGE